jgi:hypothetical protein|tara:strand:- start:1671 stop:1919 length:249 start_codon:yes stop_codon:yes gene_type:complete
VDKEIPAFKIGDFVVCDFEYISYVKHYYQQGETIDTSLYYGIIVSVDWSFYAYMEEYVYEILCLDGEKKYFMESEIKMAYSA